MNADFRCRFAELENAPESADKAWYSRRGREFEEIICALLEEEGLKPRTSYRPQGEEIDGSFFLDSRVFLLEAKWQKRHLPASAIYQFKGKVDGKLSGTLGVFISMSGYSEDAVEAVRLGKTLNVILFDNEDFRACLDQKVGFSNVVRTKLRRAAETGEIYFPYESQAILSSPSNDIVFVVEGPTDKAVISSLAYRVLQERGLDRKIDFIVAMGKTGVANIANSLQVLQPLNAKVVFVVDSDGDAEGTRSLIAPSLQHEQADLLIVDPYIEAWLFPGETEPLQRLREIMGTGGILRKEQAIEERLAHVDIEELQEVDKAFNQLTRLIVESAG